MRPITRLVALAAPAGLLAVAACLILTTHLPAPAGVSPSASLLPIVVLVLLTLVGQSMYVRVKHGATTEELNFLEAALAAAALSLPAPTVMAVGFAGVLLAELALRRAPIKAAYNLGTNATAAATMMTLFYLISGGRDRFSWVSVTGLLLSSVVFAVVNILWLAQLMLILDGTPRRQTLRDEWTLSAMIGIGGAGVGMLAVAVAGYAPALIPFTALPALALWYAYGSAAQHAEARERNRWLVVLGGLLAEYGEGAETLPRAARALQQIFNAPELLLVTPQQAAGLGSKTARRLFVALSADPGPRELAEDELPEHWRNGVVTRLDVGVGEPGAILLGSATQYKKGRLGRTAGWRLTESDSPVLRALVAALGSSLRAGASFTALSEETAKLTAVVDNTSDGIAMVDETGRVRLWSKTMARMTGITAAELEAIPDRSQLPLVVATLLDGSVPTVSSGPTDASEATVDSGPTDAGQTSSRPDDLDNLALAGPMFGAVAGAGATTSRVHLVRPDGDELDVIVSSVRVQEAATSAAPESGGWVSILTVHDETRERRVERMKTDFVATISHELRTPITPIKGYAHLLATRGERIPPEKRAQALQTICDRADHLTRLVDDLLLASRVSEGARLAVEIEVAELSDVVNQAVTSFPGLTGRVKVELPGTPVDVRCDPVRAIQCLSNLLGNAEKYTPAGSPIEVWAEASPMQVRIHVRDHGPGIPRSQNARVFERFYRLENPLTMRTGGAGLGLHIARELAIAMGGGLTLNDPPGGGAEFVLHLPTAAAPSAAQGNRAADSQMAPRSPRSLPPDAPRPTAPSGAGGTIEPQSQADPLAGAGGKVVFLVLPNPRGDLWL